MIEVTDASDLRRILASGKIASWIMKTTELTAKQVVSVRCPICGAATGKVCKLSTGAPRNEPHRDRKLHAADAVEMKLSKHGLLAISD